MPRINIEESIWSDPRFLKLCIKLGDEAKAIGSLVIAWRVAQKFYCPNREPIPKADFDKTGLTKNLVEVGLATTDGNGSVRIAGCEQHFAWWFQRQEAGRLGGLAKARRATESSLAAASDSLDPLSGVKQNVASYSSSSSPSSSKSSKVVSTVVEAPTSMPTTPDSLINLFDSKFMNGLRSLYPRDGWIEREAIKAINWANINSRKKPRSAKGWKQFFTGWLERGWERERKSLPSANTSESISTGYADV